MKYFSFNDYCRREFGCKLYKLSLDGGMTCPNRDGTVGTSGCIFCSEDGSGEFAERRSGSVAEQLERAKKRVAAKNKNGKYIAYFQSFTNTYAETEYLRRIFTQATAPDDIKALSIATRPDCLPRETLSLLRELNEIKPVWVELGLQTSRCRTAEYIGRGYENAVYKQAVSDLSSIGVKTVTHVILGLPGEEYSDMENSVRFSLDCGTWGLKLQLLHILKGSGLEKPYLDGEISCLSMEEYIETVVRLLKIIPENVVIHRLTGDGDKKKLLAPMWSADKKRVLNSLRRAIEQT